MTERETPPVDWFAGMNPAAPANHSGMQWLRDNQHAVLLSALSGAPLPIEFQGVNPFGDAAPGLDAFTFTAKNATVGPKTLEVLGYDASKLDAWKDMIGGQASTPRAEGGEIDWAQVLSSSAARDALTKSIATGSERGISSMGEFREGLTESMYDGGRSRAKEILNTGKGTNAYASAVEWLQQDRAHNLMQAWESPISSQPGTAAGSPKPILNPDMSSGDKALAHGGWLGSQGTTGTAGIDALGKLLQGDPSGTDLAEPLVEEILG